MLSPFPPLFILLILRPRFSHTLNSALTLIVPSLVLLISNFSGGRRESKRAVKKVEAVNMGPENRKPSREIGTAASPLSSSSSSSSSSSESSNGENGEVLHVVEGLMGILKVSPEHSKAVASTVDLLKEQVMKIEELKGVLGAVRTELSSMVGGLDSADVLVIKSLQDMIYDVLDMLDDNDEGEAGSAAPPSSSSSTRIFNAA